MLYFYWDTYDSTAYNWQQDFRKENKFGDLEEHTSKLTDDILHFRQNKNVVPVVSKIETTNTNLTTIPLQHLGRRPVDKEKRPVIKKLQIPHEVISVLII